MTGSPAVAAFIAFWAFWVLLVLGWLRGDLRAVGVTAFVLLWLAGFVGLRQVAAGLLFTPYVAVLDIALVFAVFNGDVKLT